MWVLGVASSHDASAALFRTRRSWPPSPKRGAAARHGAELMTITFDVQARWRDRIPAVVHVDGTARPRVVRRDADCLAIGPYWVRPAQV